MGENKHLKELDTFVKKYVKEIDENAPSVDFTSIVMKTIAIEKTSKNLNKTKALISKKGWFCISVLFLSLVFVPFQSSDKKWFGFIEIDFSFLKNIPFYNFSDFLTISNTFLIAVSLFGLMLMTQIIFLKNHFNKRFN
ncbi:hypothetical protein DUT90_05380 [Polaribacter sp. WD7]|uniref:hypothetical protein n=1 Tax=Polaribacter sp. WD7 TaxID=2269061 RepID=UPI000DF355C5|nr:hypothetical protein [Polaribacter sp. WD7]RCS27545.1 hypothetical protein DUT90_05380 [Polaribacter sp. WD7]